MNIDSILRYLSQITVQKIVITEDDVTLNYNNGNIVLTNNGITLPTPRWKEEPGAFVCSLCGFRFFHFEKTPYCPMCGCEMED